MKYQVGDEIIVLHSHEEGKVIEIMSDKMVMIEVRGVKFPAYTDQIDFPYFHRFSKKPVVQEKKKLPKQYIDQLPKEKQPQTNIKTAEGVWLSFIPKFSMDDFGDEVVEVFKVYLVNRTPAGYQFIYKQQFFGRTDFELKNEVPAQKDFYLHDISFESLNDNPSFALEFSLMQPDKKKAEYLETLVKIKAKQMFQKIEELKEKNEPTISYPLFTTYPEKKEEERLELSSLSARGIKVYEASKARQYLPPARSVIDLHMEKLIDDWKHMSNLEILGIQLAEFEKWYELAIAHHQASLIVIHGVGSGRLKEEIHEILKTKKEVKYFVNQYDPRFGYGATEILFQY